MDTAPLQFFTITLEMLQKKKIFSFDIYLFNPGTEQHFIFLSANSPLTSSRLTQIKKYLENKHELRVEMKQQAKFLSCFEMKFEEVPSLFAPVKELQEAKSLRQKRLEQSSSMTTFHLRPEFRKAMVFNDFMPLIERVKNEIMAFSPTISSTVSLATTMAEKLFGHDNLINRITAVSYFLAQKIAGEDQQALSEIFLAGLFHHIGLTRLPIELLRQAHQKHNSIAQKQYRKHVVLAHHLLKKSQIEISDRCYTIIIEHHERSNSDGYPMGKPAAKLDILGQILGAVSQIFEFSNGDVTGEKIPLESTIRRITQQIHTPGLDLFFLEDVIKALAFLISDAQDNKSAA